MKKIPVMIVSGFLGVGKTTFIRKILHEIGDKKNIMVIENDFGEVNFDAQSLSGGGVEVKELTHGCICCSLVGNFKTALLEAIDEAKVDLIIIEPSGVGKLSDIRYACNSTELKDKLEIRYVITLADAVRSPLYAKNFGEFFVDQIGEADIIFLSHLSEDSRPGRVKTTSLVRKYNNKAHVHTEGWNNMAVLEFLEEIHLARQIVAQWREQWEEHEQEGNGKEDCLGCTHDLVDHDGCVAEGNHHHHHHEEQPFVAYTFNVEEPRYLRQYEDSLDAMAKLKRKIVRAKGILPCYMEAGDSMSYVEIQFVSGEYQIKPTKEEGNYLTVISHTMSQEQVEALWG